MRHHFAVKLAVIVMGVAACAQAAYAAPNDFQWRDRIEPGKAIEIKGVNGDIVAEASSTGEVEVTATKTGADAAAVNIEVVEHDDGVTICAVYPGPKASAPNECKPGKAGRMNVRNQKAKVRFTVRVPAGVRFVGRTVNGKIEATSLASEVEAHSVNGGVRVSTSEHARAKTVNAPIAVTMGKTGFSKPVELETVNGGITVDLPANTDADLEVRTVDGRIKTDLPLTVRGEVSPRRLSATIGDGGPKLSLKTVNGAISLRQAE